MAVCGERIERYAEVRDRVPFYRLATWAELKLKQAEDMERQIAEMKKNS